MPRPAPTLRDSLFEGAIRHAAYPALALGTLAYLAHELARPRADLGRHYGLYLLGVILSTVLLETLHPLRRAWGMTRRHVLRRDLPFLALGAATLGASQWLATQFVTAHALSPGVWLAELPLLPGVIASLLITDFLWYWVHRWSHEGRGPLGRFLGRVHVAHHLPAQVYVLMHAIGHPLNAVIVRALLTVPPFLLGFSPEVAFAASVLTGLQGLVSHWNVDSRAGWLNRVLIGTELHRFHHAADPAEMGNYAAVLSIWDQIFGTYVYRPGRAPRALGLDRPERYPDDTDLRRILMHPFRPGP